MKKIGNLFAVLGVIFMVWIFASWIDTINHNNPMNEETYQNFSKWNFFDIVFMIGEDWKWERTQPEELSSVTNAVMLQSHIKNQVGGQV